MVIIITSVQKILTSGRIARGRIFTGEKLLQYRPVRGNAVGCRSRADAVINFFAAYTEAVTHNTFHWAGQPPKLPTIVLGILDLNLIILHWAHQNYPLKRHLDRFSRFCRVHERFQQTDTQTWRHISHATPTVAIECI